MTRTRILFVAEDITLSQVVRLRWLAQTLDPARYEVIFACARFPELIFAGCSFEQRVIHSVHGPAVLRAVERGTALYDQKTLARYVDEEVALMRELRPALVVGDLRLSLAVSAPLCAVPCASLGNAFWHRHAERERFPVPDFPVLRWLPPERAQRYFEQALPWVLRRLAAPLNALRRRHGLPALRDLIDALNFGDHVLYADVPELVPVRKLAAHEHYLGPVIWSAALPVPAALEHTREARRRVYVTLGSSGRVDFLEQLLRVLCGLDVQVLLATAGRFDASRVPRNVHAAELLPGDWAARHSELVICNGGASTAYQALAAGTPVLGLPANIDQWLAMSAIERSGAGRTLRMRGASDDAVRAAICALLDQPAHRAAAQQVGRAFRGYDAAARFRAFVDEATAAPQLLAAQGTNAGSPLGPMASQPPHASV